MKLDFLNNKSVWYATLGVSVAVILGAIGLFWLYSSPITSAKLAVLRSAKLPVGKVGGEFVTIGGMQNVVPETFGSVFLQHSQGVKLNQLFRNYNIKKTADIATHDLVKIWWTGNSKLNPKYAQMQTLEARVNKGEEFGGLAKQFSEDPATKIFGGDAGFVLLADALPEFRAAVEPMNQNDFKIVPTRHGLELVKVAEIITDTNGTKLTHIYHITMQNPEFDGWLSQELKKIPVKLYIK